MRTPTHRLLALLAASTVAAVSSVAIAQNATPPAPGAAPARETPRPQDIDPAVNTSATPSAPARETPRPEDINPGVDTSSAAQSPDQPAPGAVPSSRAGGASAPPATGQSAVGQSVLAQPAAPANGLTRTGPKGKALDRLELDTTQITGNRELPKVLYIVPWKRSDLGDLVGKPVNSLLDEVLAPVDRDVFRRENRYYRALTPGADQGVGSEYSDGTSPYQRATPGSAPPAAGSLGSATSTKPSTSSGSAASPPGNEK
jgi:hypothetical protein